MLTHGDPSHDRLSGPSSLSWAGPLRPASLCPISHTRPILGQTLAAALRDQQQGLPVVAERQTVRQFFTRWLEDTARHRVRPSTFRRYEEFTRLRIVPALGKLALTKLTPQHLSHLYSDLLADGLSPRTVEF